MKALNKTGRAALRLKFGGRCSYCGVILPEKGWHADHVEPVARQLKFARDKNDRTIMVPTGKLYMPENDRADNLYPACAPCNIDKSGISLEDWRHRLNDLPDNLRRNSATFRHAERFRRVSAVAETVVFWFETFVPVTGEALAQGGRLDAAASKD